MTDALTTCPHCGRIITDAELMMLDTIDFSGCPLDPQCPPKKTLQPSDAWPDEGSDDDDEGDDVAPREPVLSGGAPQ